MAPANGQYTATVTISESAFSGTTEVIPAGRNVYELSSSTDKGNKGLNQNYFTQGAVGTQTGPVSLGQPTVFTSPSNGAKATQTFTVQALVTETYVLGNSYMGSPSTITLAAPSSGCTPPPPPPPTVSVTAATQCTAPLNGTFTAAIDVRSSSAFTVPAGTSGGAAGKNLFTPTASGEPSNFNAGDTTFTVGGLTQSTVYAIGAPGGNVATVTLAAPNSGCTPPPPGCPSGDTLVNGQCVPPTGCPSGDTLANGKCVPPTTCPSGETLSGGQCVPPTACPAGESLSGGVCAKPSVIVPPAKTYPGVCRASTHGYKVRAGQEDTIVVSVTRHGVAVAASKVRITLPGGKTVSKTTGKNGKATFTVEPTQSGTIFVRSPSCKEMVKVKVYAAKAATVQRAPSFTG